MNCYYSELSVLLVFSLYSHILDLSVMPRIHDRLLDNRPCFFLTIVYFALTQFFCLHQFSLLFKARKLPSIKCKVQRVNCWSWEKSRKLFVKQRSTVLKRATSIWKSTLEMCMNLMRCQFPRGRSRFMWGRWDRYVQDRACNSYEYTSEESIFQQLLDNEPA